MVIAENPDNPMALEYLCFSWIAVGRHAEAVEGLRRVLEMGLDRGQTHLNLGIALYATGEHEQARLHWELALELDPNDVAAAKNLVMLHERRGDAEGTARWRRRVREIKGGE